ncbi:MAG TPA: isoprenylcysteine carboxylmethyltransferase family protein [Terracidiphilus sp.]|nr:isoprenylcysteine carboxylmethyltransferase family protein [Terracidiphilus sp.]
MRASTIEFRLRMLIMTTIVVVGFWSPWIEAWDLGRRISLLEWLALELSRAGLVRFVYATPVVIVVGSMLAAAGAVLRVWGSAYLGSGIVQHRAMQAGAVMADGPYRYVRNPLYLGGWCMLAAMAFVMPPTGALFAMTLLAIFLLRLILAEEAFLTAQLGEPYREYMRAVPRLIPRLRGALPAAGHKPHWFMAFVTELNPIGVLFTLAVLSWWYDNELMLKAILVSFGVSLVARALVPQQASAKPDPA